MPSSAPLEQPRSVIDWSKAWPGVIWAGLVEAVFPFLGLGLLAGGFLSVFFYRRREPQQTISLAMGAKLGVVSGGLGFFLLAILTSVGTLWFHVGSEMHDAVLRSIDEAAARNPAPEAQQVFHYMKSPEGFGLMLALGLMATLILFLVLSSLAGALGASTLGRKNRA